MGPALLRMVYYAATGVILSSISWGTISYSAITGDYLLSLILVGMMFYVVGNFFVDRWGLAGGPHDLHSTKLWKLPRTATPGDLWLRVAFNTLVGIAGYSALAAIVVLVTTAHPAFMALLGALFLLRMPHLYWSMHGRYDRAPATVGNQQKWDTSRAERSGAGWRSCKLPESPVMPSSPFDCLSLHLPSAL